MPPSRQDAAVHQGVQRLDAAVHHLGKSGHFGDADDGKSRGFECPRRTAGRHELETARGKTARELDEAGLIGNAQERSRHGNRAHVGAILPIDLDKCLTAI